MITSRKERRQAERQAAKAAKKVQPNVFTQQGPRAKELGQIFTPFGLVKEMLDKLQIWNLPLNQLKWKTVLEPSCGNGQFILGLIRKFMDAYSKDWSMWHEDVRMAKGMALTHIMQNQIYAVELDPEMRDECLKRCHEMFLAYGVSIPKLNHNIIVDNALEIDVTEAFTNNIQNWEMLFVPSNVNQLAAGMKFRKAMMVIDSPTFVNPEGAEDFYALMKTMKV